MPVAFDHGILGLEATWTWNDGFVINETASGLLPRLKLDRVAGLGSLSEFEDLRANAIGRIGEVLYPTGPRGKTIVLEGRLQAASLEALRAAAYDLRAAFADRSSEGTMQVEPNATYHGGGDGPVWEFYGRSLQLDMDEEQTVGPRRLPSPYQRRVQIGIRQSDPRFYLATDEKFYTGAASPIAVSNPGSAPVDPVIVVQNASGDVTVGRGGGYQLVFEDLDGSNLTLDFRSRTAFQGSDNVGAKMVVADSNWWDPFVEGLPTGTTNVTRSGGTGMEISYKPASW